MQSQQAVTAHFSSEQLLPVGFARAGVGDVTWYGTAKDYVRARGIS